MTRRPLNHSGHRWPLGHSAIRGLALILLTALAAQACQATGSLAVRPGGDKAEPSRKPGASAAPSAAPTPGAGPASAAPTGAPAATPTAGLAPAPLQPAPGTVALKGTIRLDAAYAIAAGAGRVVANHGAEAVAFAESALIANNTANLIANNGGGVLASWGAGLVANNSGNIISDKGSGLITDNGAALISDKGAGLISDKGAGFILLQAPAAPLVGAILPAAGMLVGVADLRTGELRPIGQDATGAPAYAVYSDAAGGYTLHLPADLAANVAVVAVPPAAPRVDPRLSFDLVTAPRGDAAAIDEDTALASRFMRDFLTGNITDALAKSDPAEIKIKTEAVGDDLKAVIIAFFREINEEARKVGLNRAPRAEIGRVAARMSDTVLAHVDLPGVMISKTLSPRWDGADAPALPAMVAVLRDTREKATEALRQDPGFAAKQPYLVDANAKLPEAERYVIAKPADLGDFIVKEYLLTARRPTEGIDEVFNSLGAGRTLPDGANSRRIEIEAGVLAISGGIITALIANQGGAHDEAIGLIRAWKPAP